MNCWLLLGVMAAASAVAQDNTNTLPAIPAPVVSPAGTTVDTNAPVAAQKPKAVKHRRKKTAAPIVEPTVTLVPGPATVAVKNVNARGQAGLKGEVVAHLKEGDSVTVLEQINLDKHKAGEPAQWAKIALPASTHAWVSARFIDPETKTVKTKKLNLRAGPGENYSVLGVIEHGATVNEITTKGGWIQIEPPSDSYAFVAAMYLKQEAVAVNPPPSAPAPPPPPATPPQPVVVMGPAPANRTVTHEGVVGPVASIVAPTAYKLYDPDTYQTIDYLYTTDSTLDFSRYNNMRIVATGEESLDERWKGTPLLTVESIRVIETNAVKFVPIKHNH